MVPSRAKTCRKRRVKSASRLVRNYGYRAAAVIERRLIRRTAFITIYGKTTATQCLGHVLSETCSTNFTPLASNARLGLAEVILKTRPIRRFTPIEVGTNKPGALWRAAWMIHPDIVVVLAVDRVELHG